MSSPVVQTHIHFGAGRTNGYVMVFLCGGPKPACPASGTVTGTIAAADVSILPASNGDSVIRQVSSDREAVERPGRSTISGRLNDGPPPSTRN